MYKKSYGNVIIVRILRRPMQYKRNNVVRLPGFESLNVFTEVWQDHGLDKKKAEFRLFRKISRDEYNLTVGAEAEF